MIWKTILLQLLPRHIVIDDITSNHYLFVFLLTKGEEHLLQHLPNIFTFHGITSVVSVIPRNNSLANRLYWGTIVDFYLGRTKHMISQLIAYKRRSLFHPFLLL